MWKRADHRHVLRFLGTYEDEEQCILVLPWIENGDLVTYLFNNPPADVTIRRALVRFLSSPRNESCSHRKTGCAGCARPRIPARRAANRARRR